jgi:hemerythrin-like domain-containing protein
MMGKATQDLRKEHDSILHVLEILDEMMSAENKEDTEMLQYYREIVYFLKTFADKCHHGKEENHLFTELTVNGILNEGGPVGVMLHEHGVGRDYIALMDKALESGDLEEFKAAAKSYSNLLRNHIEKENGVLFVMADRVLSDEKQDELFEHFEEREEKVIGHGVHEELHAMIDKWSKAFVVH